MQRVFYILWFVMLLFVIISLKDKGCIHILYMFLLAFGLIFLIIWEFSGKNWSRKFAGYLMFIASILIWYAGLGRLVTNVYGSDCFPLLIQYW